MQSVSQMAIYSSLCTWLKIGIHLIQHYNSKGMPFPLSKKMYWPVPFYFLRYSQQECEKNLVWQYLDALKNAVHPCNQLNWQISTNSTCTFLEHLYQRINMKLCKSNMRCSLWKSVLFRYTMHILCDFTGRLFQSKYPGSEASFLSVCEQWRWS